ncbi:restriction endonuclease, SacI family [Archaeoglobus sp.]
MVEIDITRANELLKTIWDEISKKDKLNETSCLTDVIAKINGKMKSYKYALLTQVLTKAVNPSIYILALQKQLT